jgi:hypothetical protein
MLIAINKEDLITLLESQIKDWEEVGGGANYEAYEFNPRKVDRQQLIDLGFYENRDAWIAGVQIKKLNQFLNEVKEIPGIRI